MKSDTRRAVFAHLPGPVWNDRYESLRAAWLATTTGWGQALFLKQGLVAWMKAWPVEERSRTSHSDAHEATAPCELSSDVERQVTGELVNIILDQQHDTFREAA